MDQKTKELIEKFEGLDFCCSGRQRIDCPKHMWDIPAYIRQRHEKKVRERIIPIKPLTEPLDNVKTIQLL